MSLLATDIVLPRRMMCEFDRAIFERYEQIVALCNCSFRDIPNCNTRTYMFISCINNVGSEKFRAIVSFLISAIINHVFMSTPKRESRINIQKKKKYRMIKQFINYILWCINWILYILSFNILYIIFVWNSAF